MLKIILVVCVTVSSALTTFAQAKVVVIPLQGEESTWEGSWQAERPYRKGDVVENQGSSYISLMDHESTKNDIPPTQGFWELIAEKGSQGDIGPQGPTGVPGYILGQSSQTSNGRFTFNNATGVAAATEMCKATYSSEPSAHLCSYTEIQNALSTKQYDFTNTSNISNTQTWAISPSASGAFFTGTAANSCQNFGANAGDISRGTRLFVSLNFQTSGNSGGVVLDYFDLRSEIPCNQIYSVMCCR